MFRELDRVALVHDLPTYGLKAGAVGTVMLAHSHPPGVTVEFFTGDHPWSHESGEAYPAALVDLLVDQVRLVEAAGAVAIAPVASAASPAQP